METPPGRAGIAGGAGSITIVTGCPGTGKTTVAARLASASTRGLHLETDPFYGFPAHPIDPTQPESHAQNTTILRAIGRAAGAFAEGGYDVFVDGIVGPWFLPTFLTEIPAGTEVHYVVLEAPLGQALERVRQRQGSGESAKVEHMHRAFQELGEYAGCALDASRADPATLAERLAERRAAGALRIRPA